MPRRESFHSYILSRTYSRTLLSIAFFLSTFKLPPFLPSRRPLWPPLFLRSISWLDWPLAYWTSTKESLKSPSQQQTVKWYALILYSKRSPDDDSTARAGARIQSGRRRRPSMHGLSRLQLLNFGFFVVATNYLTPSSSDNLLPRIFIGF